MSTVTVLVVEDTALLAKHFERQLRCAGYEVVLARHVYGALEIIDEINPDVLVLDMLLGGANAMTLLHELQSHDDLASMPVVLVTQLASELKLEDMRPYGVRVILDKTTMRPDDLTEAVGAVL